MRNAKEQLRSWARFVVKAARVPEADRSGVVRDIVRRLNMRTSGRERAWNAAKVIRSYWHKTGRIPSDVSLPQNIAEIGAIVDYEEDRERRHSCVAEVGDGSYHDARFAEENGVCPRCSSSKRLADDRRSCACGWQTM